MPLRSLSWMTSAALHATLAGFMLVQWTGGSASYEAGDGEDLFATESGITLEGIGFGDALSSTAAVEEQAQESSAAQPEITEVKAPEVVEERPDEVVEELPEETEVLTSSADDAPALEAEAVQEEEQPVVEERPREAQVATLEQVQQAALKEQIRAGAKQRGGSPDARRKYLGKLRQHLEKTKINPRSRRTGLVVVRFSVGREGEVITREVVTSSGSSVLDKAAVASIDKAAPFPVRPEAMNDDPLVVSVPFRFSVRQR